jgi:glucan 1,3-beta-glucosidase
MARSVAQFFGIFLFSAAIIWAGWWWLGRPVPMPASPLAAGEKLQCVSYAPFRGEQNPFDNTFISADQIEQDLKQLAAITDCIRIYSLDRGLAQIPEIAERHGLKVMLGLWVSDYPDRTKLQIDAGIALANRYPATITSVVVGNEVLLRGEKSGTALAALIRQVKAAVPATTRVTYADVWEFWLKNLDLAAAVDFVTIHILPYWEDIPIAAPDAAAHVAAIRREVGEALPNKEIFIGEVGWPSAGRMREGALPSPTAQGRVLHDVLAVLKRDHVRANVIEAFDQPWKRKLEGTVGGHWGLFDGATRGRKFVWGEPISDHPLWPWLAVVGTGLAVLIMLVGAWGHRGGATPAVTFGIAANATIGGLLLGWTIEKAMVESLALGGSIRSLFLVGLAIFAPVVGGLAITRGTPLPALSEVLGPSRRNLAGSAKAVGLTFAVLTVVAISEALRLVFDPRYQDFAFTALTGAALPFLIVTLLKPKTGSQPMAEAAGAVTLGLSAAFIVFNEGLANWQSLWLSGALVTLMITLLRSRAAPG